jgi:hypothetical protein
MRRSQIGVCTEVLGLARCRTHLVSALGFMVLCLLISNLASAPAHARTPSPEIFAVSCAKKRVCAAAGRDWRTGRAYFMNTKSGGKRWKMRALPGQGEAYSVDCPSARRCVVGGISRDTGAATWSTFDAGLRWTTGRIPNPPNGLQTNSMSCPSVRHCVGAMYSAIGVSKDGGVRWKLTRYARPSISGVSCPTPKRCFAVGSSGRGALFGVSRNGGSKWNFRRLRVFGKSTTNLEDIECPTRRHCYVGGFMYQRSGGVIAFAASTSNGGRSWRWRMIGRGTSGDSRVQDVSCWAAAQCMAVAQDDLGSKEVSISAVTRNGGRSWNMRRIDNVGRFGGLFSVSCPSPKWCLAGGADGSGTLLMSSKSSGKNWTKLR